MRFWRHSLPCGEFVGELKWCGGRSHGRCLLLLREQAGRIYAVERAKLPCVFPNWDNKEKVRRVGDIFCGGKETHCINDGCVAAEMRGFAGLGFAGLQTACGQAYLCTVNVDARAA